MSILNRSVARPNLPAVSKRPTYEFASPTRIEPKLIDFYRAREMQLGLRTFHDVLQAQDASYGWEPVTWGEIESLASALEGAGIDPKKIGFIRKHGDDLLHRGDMYLAVRSFESRDMQRAADEQRREVMESSDSPIDALEEALREIRGGATKLRRLTVPVDVPPVRDHVANLSGQEIVRQQQEQIAELQRKLEAQGGGGKKE